MDDPQLVQDGEYQFPYHYIAGFAPDFNQHVSDTWGMNYVSTIEFLLNRLDGLGASSIVDVGCGDGRFTRELAMRFPGHRICGLDYSQRAIAVAKAMNADIPGISFQVCDIAAEATLPPFEVAVLMEVFEHIPPAQADRFLAGLHRLLVPGGTLLLTVPHVNHALERKHYRHFSDSSLRTALGDRFEILEMIPFERISPWRRVVASALANRWFVLNHRRSRNWLYGFYKRRLFDCADESECLRLFVRARAR